MRATWSAALVVPFTLLLAACGAGDRSAAESTDLMSETSRDSMAGGNKVIGVMSRNLYLGADLGPVISAGDPAAFVGATTAVWLMVKNNDFRTRAQALAAEIAATRPALIGLQEAVTWRTQSPSDGTATSATDVKFDYVPDLLRALKARGLVYREVARVTLLDVEAPTAPALDLDIRLTDHDAILAREDVHVTKSEGDVFKHLLTVPTLVGPVTLPRGWVSVDVKYRGEELRFVSTHLESFDPGIRALQAGDLAEVLAKETRPVILVGDLNSEPGVTGDGEAILAGAGFEDVWPALHPGPGLTCCFLENLRLTQGAKLDQRIDYVLTRGPFEPRKAVVVGADPSSRFRGLWPSDHAGVFAEVRIGQ
jgi:endonuclease/exonuclease/phosphatase family metal-dependent hydrolase